MAGSLRAPGAAAASRGQPKVPVRGRRRLTTIGAAVGLVMGFTALSHQYAKTYTLAREESRLAQRRHELIADNARLREEIERLRTDDRYIEEIARRQLGLVRPGEIELFIVPYDGSPSAPGGGANRAMRAGTELRRQPVASPAPAPEGSGNDVASQASRRGIGAWAIAVRDAVRRLFRLASGR